MKSKQMRWARHVDHIGESRGVYMRERVYLGDPGVDGSVILRGIFRSGSMEWIELAQDSDKWQALVTAVMNLRFP